MALRADSYGTVVEVLAFTRHLLDSAATFSSETVPTDTQIEKFIDRASAYVNIALNTHGFTTPVTNSTAVLMLDDWVVNQASMYTELTQRGAGFSEEEGSRTSSFKSLGNSAMKFVEVNALGLKRLGVPVGHSLSDGLAFTALDDQDERADPDDSALEQPVFTRGLFGASSNDANGGED